MQYLIPATLAFFGGLILWLIKRERVSLQYETVESGTFPHEKGEGRYFIIKLKNSGNKPLRDIKLKISFSMGNIHSYSFSSNDLITDVQMCQDHLTGSIPLLNPKEVLGTTITTIGHPASASPEVLARASGATAVRRKTDSDRIDPVFSAVTVGLAVITLVYVGWNYYSSKSQSTEMLTKLSKIEGKVEAVKTSTPLEEARATIEKETLELKMGKPEAVQVVFAAFNKGGMSSLFPRLISLGGDCTYWRTGFFLMHSFLNDAGNEKKYLKIMDFIIEQNIAPAAPSSKGLLLYLSSKMSGICGDKDLAMKYLDRCKKEAPMMYDHLIAQDPAYDLDSIKKWLNRNKN